MDQANSRKGWLGCLAALACVAAADAAPRMACDSPVFDFGVVTNRSDVSHRFRLSNAGDAVLRVLDVQSGCLCAVAGARRFAIEPGAATDLVVRVELAGWRGLQRKALYVSSDDPATPRLALEVRGCAVRDLEAWPRELSFGVVQLRERAMLELRIISPTGRRYRIEGVDAFGSGLVATLAGLSNGEQRISVVLDAPAEAGPVSGRIEVRTDCAGAERIEVPVRAFVQGDVTVIPSELLIPMDASPGGRIGRALLVRARTGGDLRVLSVALPDPEMRSDAQPLERGAWRVQIDNLPLGVRLSGSNVILRVDAGNGRPQSIPVPIRIFDPSADGAVAPGL